MRVPLLVRNIRQPNCLRRNTMMARLSNLFLILLGALPLEAANRSILRPSVHVPEITTYWQHEPDKKFTLKDSHLEYGPIFRPYDKEFFDTHLLPHHAISFRRDTTQSVPGEILSQLIEGLLKELAQHRKRFTDFEVLKDTDYSYVNECGALVLKFKKYPFVVKLFSETPKNFVSPFSKGMEPGFFFIMGGGIMRHLTGFTRIKNLEEIQKLVQHDAYWSKVVDFPRKWYWLPQEPRWLVVEGKNMGNCDRGYKTTIPGLYAIIADCIKAQDRPWFDFVNSKRCLRLSQFAQYRIDPHLQNFMIEEDTGKMVVIDTENFRALVGLKERFVVDSYFDWYKKLATKCMKDRFFRTKRDRKNAQLANWDVYTS